jgi:hypothetical protein
MMASTKIISCTTIRTKNPASALFLGTAMPRGVTRGPEIPRLPLLDFGVIDRFLFLFSAFPPFSSLLLSSPLFSSLLLPSSLFSSLLLPSPPFSSLLLFYPSLSFLLLPSPSFSSLLRSSPLFSSLLLPSPPRRLWFFCFLEANYLCRFGVPR